MRTTRRFRSALLATLLLCTGALASDIPKAIQEKLNHFRASGRDGLVTLSIFACHYWQPQQLRIVHFQRLSEADRHDF